jgi:hypothetical protein
MGINAPEVECIGCGKARAPYEFGYKVSITTPATAPKGRTRLIFVDLLPKVTIPTIVFLASMIISCNSSKVGNSPRRIPNARFVTLESANHALLSSEPAWLKFVSDTEAFLSDES